MEFEGQVNMKALYYTCTVGMEPDDWYMYTWWHRRRVGSLGKRGEVGSRYVHRAAPNEHRLINNTGNGGVAGSPAPNNCNGGVFISASSYDDNVTSNEQTEAIEPAYTYICMSFICIHIHICIIWHGVCSFQSPLPYRLAAAFEVSTVRCSFHKRNRRCRYYIIAIEIG